MTSTMAYGCELGNGQWLYLDQSGSQTIVTLASSSASQQQQSSQSFATGDWLSPPEVFRTGSGVIVKLSTAGGDRWLQVQGSVTLLTQSPSLDSAQSLPLQQSNAPSLKPMPPMQPLKMGEMQMGDMQMSPMEMRMGNMEMRMGEMRMGEMRMGEMQSPAPASQRFCGQCGAAVQPGSSGLRPRFCTACGQPLGN